MKAYPKYKPSNIELIGEIPEHWDAIKLKWVCSFIYGNSLSSEDRIEGDIPVYGSNGIVGYHNKAITQKPCIIIGRKGSFGKINYSESECFPIDTTYFIDGTATKNNIRWLYFALQTLNLDSLSKDTGVPGLSREEAYNRLIIAPSIEEQHSIGHYLDDRTQKIDTLIEKKQTLSDLLKEERTATINQAITRGLNPDAPMKDSGIEWLGEIPKHWEVTKLKYLTTKIGSGVTPKGGSETYLKAGIPFIRSQNVHFEGLIFDDIAYISLTLRKDKELFDVIG
jgi:type I restriction enzyme S subunit